MVRLREHVERLHGVDAIATAKQREITRQSGRVAGNIDDTRRRQLQQGRQTAGGAAAGRIEHDDVEVHPLGR